MNSDTSSTNSAGGSLAPPGTNGGWRARCLAVVMAGLLGAAYFIPRYVAAVNHSVNLNESFAWMMIVVEADKPLSKFTEDDPHPPLYYFLLAGAAKMGLRDVGAWRWLSVAAGALTLWLMIWLVRRTGGGGIGAAWLTGGMMALSAGLTQYDSEARMYPFLTLAITTAAAAYFQFFASGGRRGWLMAAVTAQSLALWLNNLAVFALAGLLGGCAWALAGRERRRLIPTWLAAQGLALPLWLPAAVVMRHTMKIFSYMTKPFIWEQFMLTMQRAETPPIVAWYWNMTGRNWALALIGAGLLVHGFCALGRARVLETTGNGAMRQEALECADPAGARTFLRMAAGLIILASLTALLTHPESMRPYTYLFAVPFMLWLIAEGVMAIPLRAARVVIIALGAYMMTQATLNMVTVDFNEPWQQTVRTLMEIRRKSPYPVFVVEPYANYLPYLNGYKGPGVIHAMPQNPNGSVEEDEIQEILDHYHGGGLVSGNVGLSPICVVLEYHVWHTRRHERLHAFLQRNGRKVYAVTHPSIQSPGASDIRIVIYELKREQK